MRSTDRLTAQTIELLQLMIRNKCVNDGSPESGQEVRNVGAIRALLDGTRAEVETVEPAPGRVSLVARLEGSDRTQSPSLCLMGHTDVVPATAEGWRRDPFGGELVAGEVWGRGSVDMLGQTASMAVAFRELAISRHQLRGDVVLLASADEEAGSRWGVRWLAENRPDLIQASFVLTESGGTHSGSPDAPAISVAVGEKGVAWRRIRIRGEEGHGSRPFRVDSALVKAAAVIGRIAAYQAPARFHTLWPEELEPLNLTVPMQRGLFDPHEIDRVLAEMPDKVLARQLHASTHTTLSPNALSGTTKINVIPGVIDLDVDIRLMPGDDIEELDARLRQTLSDLDDSIEIEALLDSAPTLSSRDTPLWLALERAVKHAFPASRLRPYLSLGFTDARILRQAGVTAYGAGLMSSQLSDAELSRRIHGTNERIDVESLELCTKLWMDVTNELLR